MPLPACLAGGFTSCGTHATILLNAGEPVHEVANRLGHADVHETLNTYAQIIEARQNGLGDRFAAALGRSS